MLIETITADLLQHDDIIESHDGEQHRVVMTRWNDYARTVEVDVHAGAGRYTVTFDYDDEVRVVG